MTGIYLGLWVCPMLVDAMDRWVGYGQLQLLKSKHHPGRGDIWQEPTLKLSTNQLLSHWGKFSILGAFVWNAFQRE